MTRTESRTSSRKSSIRSRFVRPFVVLLATAFLSIAALSQTTAPEPNSNGFRIGERLTYAVTIGRYPGAAYCELYTVSRGRLGDRDAIELRSKFKTLDLASAAVYLIDETRTTFASPSTGLPLHTTISKNASGLPKDTIHSFLATPTTHFDLLTMIYRIRQSGGNGSLTLQEGDKVYPVTFQTGLAEKHKTEAGEFETTVVSIQSDYFTELGLTEVRLNITSDDARLPVLVRFKSPKGNFRMALASVQTIEPEVETQPTPTPVRTPVPERTPKPISTPVPYIDNQPLPSEVAFQLGETLIYNLVAGGQPVAKMRLAAKERKQFNGVDSLLLEAAFYDVAAGSPIAAGDYVRAYVDPETLAPRQIETKFSGVLRSYSGTAMFAQEGSAITFNGTNRVEAPVGTHSILSLLYAARSFNLRPSLDRNNPINDTRVAVFWENQPYVFTIRPNAPEVITIDGRPTPAQMISVSTKNAALDQLNIRVWLGNDDARTPLRFSLGQIQADLVTNTRVQP